MKKTLIVSAYAIFPIEKSSEGIVNKNWIDIISTKNDVFVLHSESVVKKYDENLFSQRHLFLHKLKTIVKGKKKLSKLLYSFTNKIFMLLTLKNTVLSLNIYIWIKTQFFYIKRKDINTSSTVFWIRILPTFSLEPILKLNKKSEIPIVVNFNDPLENDEYARNLVRQSIRHTQCWTFPTFSLAKEFSKEYGMDIKRCFVIPHAMKKQTFLYQNSLDKEKLDFLYTGTFYKGAFTNSFLKQLELFAKHELYEQVQFTFILSQYNEESLVLLKQMIPNAIILTTIEREEVLKLLKKADCMFVVDAINHVNLLKGKLAEAISFGLPVFSVSYKGSVMDKIVLNYGGFSGYQDEDNHIIETLKNAVISLRDISQNSEFLVKRKRVMHYFSEENILNLTNKVNNYALERFKYQRKLRVDVPEEPTLPKCLEEFLSIKVFKK